MQQVTMSKHLQFERQADLLMDKVKSCYFKTQSMDYSVEETLVQMDSALNEHPLLASYANIMGLMYDAHVMIFKMVDSDRLQGYAYT